MEILSKSETKLRPLTLEEMEYALAFHYNWLRCLVVPNVKGLIAHEMDIVVVQPTGYLYEIEIKRTLADFKADAKKRHGHRDYKNRIVEFYWAVPEEIYESVHFMVEGTDAGLISVCKVKEGLATATVRIPAVRKKGAKKLTPNEQLRVAHIGAMRIWGLKKKVDKKNLNRKIFTDAVRSATRGRLMKIRKKMKKTESGSSFDWKEYGEISHDKYLIESIRDDMIRSLK